MSRHWPLIGVGLAVGVVAAGLAFLRRSIDVVEVRGASMWPSLRAGDRLVVMRLARRPRAGEIVIAPDPRRAGRELIKRVADIGPHGVLLRGDNPVASTDARAFGLVPTQLVAWRVVGRYWPVRRISTINAHASPQVAATASTHAERSAGSSSTPGPASAATRCSTPRVGRTARRALGTRRRRKSNTVPRPASP